MELNKQNKQAKGAKERDKPRNRLLLQRTNRQLPEGTGVGGWEKQGMMGMKEHTCPEDHRVLYGSDIITLLYA